MLPGLGCLPRGHPREAAAWEGQGHGDRAREAPFEPGLLFLSCPASPARPAGEQKESVLARRCRTPRGAENLRVMQSPISWQQDPAPAALPRRGAALPRRRRVALPPRPRTGGSGSRTHPPRRPGRTPPGRAEGSRGLLPRNGAMEPLHPPGSRWYRLHPPHSPLPRTVTEQVCRHTCVHPRCVRAHLLARRPGVLTHTHTHTLTDGTHAARMHTAHASIRRRLVCTHTPVHTHTQARTHIHAPSVGTPKRMWPSHKSIRTQGAELHMHVLLCTDTHQCAHTLIPLHARTGVCTHGLHPPPTRIHRCCTHTHCCACTRAFPCMCTHTFTFRHTRDSPVRALAGLAPQLGPTNAAGRAGSSRARSPRAAPAPAPHVCRAPKPLTSTWCAGSGTRSSPGRPSS